jgi:ubiquinone/menaquinone biosynthesis C-methylase UbiE
VDDRAAARLIQGAVPPGPATWADLGAGTGTFTLALATLVGPSGRIIAVDSDAAALAELRAAVKRAALGDRVEVRQGDFREALDMPPLDGALLANALHFIPENEQADVLARVAALLLPRGRLVVIDYDGRRANAWVPYPVSKRRLAELLAPLRLPASTVVGTRPSLYGGVLYAAVTVLD